jgi:sugar-phosphatase
MFLAKLNVKLAIASSSDLVLIESVVDRLQIHDYFEELVSAQFEPYGKPHPGVYLTTAQKLSVEPAKCLVIEDSMRGILAAKAAEMLCLAVPDPSLRGDTRLSIADWQFTTLTEFNQDFWNVINR